MGGELNKLLHCQCQSEVNINNLEIVKDVLVDLNRYKNNRHLQQ